MILERYKHLKIDIKLLLSLPGHGIIHHLSVPINSLFRSNREKATFEHRMLITSLDGPISGVPVIPL